MDGSQTKVHLETKVHLGTKVLSLVWETHVLLAWGKNVREKMSGNKDESPQVAILIITLLFWINVSPGLQNLLYASTLFVDFKWASNENFL